MLPRPADFDAWRTLARDLVAAGVPPEKAQFGEDLFAAAEPPSAAPLSVPRAFAELAEAVVCHRDPERFALLYRLLWRIHRGKRRLLEDQGEPDVRRAALMAKAVDRASHKMKAFVRFRAVAGEENQFVAWFEPDHHVVDRTAPFFVRRFANMRWSILTPERSAHWDGRELQLAEGASRDAAPDGDALEECWRTYYASIFNPARLNPGRMRQEMPKRYWRNMPEASAIKPLVASAPARAAAMIEAAPPDPVRRRGPVPEPALAVESGTLAALRAEARACRDCALWRPATQTVFGEGPEDAPIALVGEQPGDQEDLAGRPFVGPAGQLLDRALAEAGLDRRRLYVTNAVKHFKFAPRGKRRLHQKPDAREVEICGRWLSRELDVIKPRLVVLLGATAARAVLVRDVKIGGERGRLFTLAGQTKGLVTVHPSYLLRLPDEALRRNEYARFVADLRLAAPFA